MRVPIYNGNGVLNYEDIPSPHIQHDEEVLVDVAACGICGTDLNILAMPPAHKATAGIVIGHEAIGQVAEVGGGVTQFKSGDWVVVAPRLTCGKCDYCRMGLDNQCTNYETIGTTRHGGFAPQMALPQRALYQLSGQVAIEDGVFFEPLSCVVGAVARAPFQAGESVVIIGGGPMGLLFALLYRAMGAGLIVVADVAAPRLNFCRTEHIATAIDVTQTPLAEQLQSLLPLGADIVVDAVGNQIDSALSAVRRGGHIILFGLRAHDKPQVTQYRVTRYDITLHGVFVGLHPFRKTIAILENGVVQPSQLITHRLPLSQLAHGVALMRRAEAMKVIIVLNSKD